MLGVQANACVDDHCVDPLDEDEYDLDAGTAYHKVFDGECTGTEIRMYEGNGDNQGTANQRALRCSEACLTQKTPLNGVSWSGFVALGFIVIPSGSSAGRCYCEAQHSDSSCTRRTNTYDRYDWGEVLSGTASQSTTMGSSGASRAIDGNTNQNYPSGSCTHTNPGTTPWYAQLASLSFCQIAAAVEMHA